MDMPAQLPLPHRSRDGSLLHDGPIGALRFSPNGSRLLVAIARYSGSGRQHYLFTFWDCENWRVLPSLPLGDDTEAGRDFAFAPDSSLLYVLGEDAVQRFDVSSGAPVGASFPLPGPAPGCEVCGYVSLAASPDGQWLAIAERVGQRLLLLDAESGEIIRTIQVGYGAESVVAFADGGRTLLSMQSWYREDILTAFGVETGEAAVRFQGVRQHPNPLSLGVSPGGRSFALLVHAGGALRFWRTDSPIPDASLWIENPVPDVSESEFDPWGGHLPAIHRRYLHNWAFLPEGKQIVTADMDDREHPNRTITVHLREAATGSIKRTRTIASKVDGSNFLHNKIVVPLAVHPQDSLLTMGTADGRVLLWDLNCER